MNVQLMRASRGVVLASLIALIAIFAICATASNASASPKKKVTVTGSYGVPIEENFKKHSHGKVGRPVLTTTKNSYTLRLNPRTTKVLRNGRSYSWKKGKRFIRARARVTVVATQKGGTLKVRTIRLAKASKKAKTSTYSGTFRTAVIPFNFSNDTSTPYTVAGLRQDVFTASNSVQAYWREASNDTIKLSGANTSNLDGDVFNWVTIPNTNTSCEYPTWGNAAVAAAGVNPANYDRILFVHPNTSACSWNGVADTVGRSWYQGGEPYNVPHSRVIAHEFGHNFNLNHSGTAPCPVSGFGLELTATMSTVCYSAESAGGTWMTGNKINIMGYTPLSMNHISAYQKIMVGILPTSKAVSMATPGTYTLYPQELGSTPGAQLLTAPRTYTTGMNSPTLYAEYRQPYGIFDLFDGVASDDTGVPKGVQFSFAPQIRSGYQGEIDNSNGWPEMLIDGEPEGRGNDSTLDFDTLKPRQSFYDYASNRVYTVNSATATSATVETSTPPAAGNYPTVGVSGGKLVYNAGTNQHNSLYVRPSTAGDALVIVDNATPVTAGPGCTAVGEGAVSCPSSGYSGFNANLGDLSDSFKLIDPTAIPISVDGGTGGDLIDGYAVTANYASRTTPLNISLDGLANDGAAGEGDHLGPFITRVIGGSGNDTITGSADDDTIDGGLGNDTIDFGAGTADTISYENRTADLTVRLNGLPQSGAAGETDTLTNAECAIGGSGNDTISGSTITNGQSGLLEGRDGNDTLSTGGIHYQTFYGGNGNDVINGTQLTDIVYPGAGDDRIDTGTGQSMDYVGEESGNDTLDYSTRTAGRTINVANGNANGGGQENDQFNGIENIIGTPFIDTITGDAGANVLTGGAGTDTIDAGDGNDTVLARDGLIDSVTCGGGTDTARVDATDTPVNGCETITQAPETTIDSGIANGASSTTTTQAFTFSSDSSPVTFECSLDSGAWNVCTSPYTTPVLSIANHTFAVRAMDVFGGTDATPATRSFTIASPAPDTNITAGPATGITADDATATYAFAGVPSAASFQCNIDGGAWATCASPYTTPTLTVGTHTFGVRAVSSAGAADPTPATRTITVLFPALLTKTAAASTASTVPLTTDSALGASVDWIHFKNISPATVDRKNATQQISTFSVLGGSTVSTRSDSPNYTWTDAVGTASGSSKVGVATGGAVGRGFKLTVPATNTQTRTLKLYVGMVGFSTQGKLNVYFNGQPAITDTSVTGGLLSTTTKVFSITYRAASASDTLNVEWTQNQSAGSSKAVLYGAGLYNAQEPETTISSGPAQGATVTTNTASIGFTSSVSGSTFQCKLDQAAWVACSSAWTTPTLTSGLHTVRVRAIGPNGNVDKTSAVRSFFKS